MKTLEAQQVELTPTEPTNAVQLRQHQEVTPPGLTPAQAKVDAIAALTMKAYDRASQLSLTADEVKLLAADFPDDAFKQGAAGKDNLIYIEHAHLRDRFNQVFGMGQWAIVPRNRWGEDFTSGNGKPGTRIYVEAMLLVRGCFVGEAVGSMEYYPHNASQDYGDAVEGAKTAAFRRCSKELGVGLQAWKKDWCESWWKRKFEQTRDNPPRNSNTRGLNTLDQSAKSASVPGASQQGSSPGSKKPAAQLTPTEEAPKGQSDKTTSSVPPGARTVPSAGKCATVAQRDKMIEELLRTYPQDDLLTYARAKSILMPSETGEGLGDWPLRFVPSMKSQMDLLTADLTDFFEGAGSDKPPFTNPESPEEDCGCVRGTQDCKFHPGGKKPNGKPVAVPRDQGVGTWRQVEVPFGKNKGKPLGQLDNRQLRAYAKLALEDVKSPTFTGRDGKEHQKSPAALAKAKEWLKHLEAAAVEMGFTVSQGGDE